MTNRALAAICAVALLHAAFYIAHQRPDWDVSWTDQAGYQRLGEVLATTGTFTRAPDAPVFVPEVIRTPAYPAFIAMVYTVAGVGNRTAVVVAQAGLFALLCLLVFGIARRVADDRVALGAALLTALYSPLPYFGALTLTELPTAFALTAAMLALVRAVHGGRWPHFALAGALLSLTALVRPAFYLQPFFFAVAVPVLVPAERRREALGRWAVLAVAGALTLAPWFTYNYVNLGRFTISPAGGIGRAMWEVSWQGRWPGRVQAALTSAAEQSTGRDDLDARARRIAADTGNDPGPMLTYVHEWRDIHDLWDSPTDPAERAAARIAADRAYLDAGLSHIRQDPVGYVRRAMTRSVFILWAAEIPIRYSLINSVPPLVIRGLWAAQALLMLLALAGLVALARTRWLDAVVLGLPLVYVTGVHSPMFTEARQSLPAKPLVLVLAAIGIAWLVRRRHAQSG